MYSSAKQLIYLFSLSIRIYSMCLCQMMCMCFLYLSDNGRKGHVKPRFPSFCQMCLLRRLLFTNCEHSKSWSCLRLVAFVCICHSPWFQAFPVMNVDWCLREVQLSHKFRSANLVVNLAFSNGDTQRSHKSFRFFPRNKTQNFYRYYRYSMDWFCWENLNRKP